MVEQALPDMIGVLEDDPTTYDTAYLSVVAFGDTPVPVLPLTPLRDNPPISALPRQTSTNYAAVFDFLCSNSTATIRAFEPRDCRPIPRPLFVTDGNPQVDGNSQPDSQWVPYRNQLESSGFPFKPVVVALGIGNVTPETVILLRSIHPVEPHA